MALSAIHVGCTNFGRGRLQAHLDCKGLEPVACVDINIDAARESLQSLDEDLPNNLPNRVYTTITEAREKHDAQVCLIYASTTVHTQLIIESLNLGLHTLCVKPVAIGQDEFRQIISVAKENPHLMLVQSHNMRWNPAATKMRDWLREEGGIGEMLGGECRFWIRQNLHTGENSRQPDAFVEGLFFHAGASHQLDQLVAAKGLPKYVTAYVHQRQDPSLAQTGVWGTAGAQALLEYANGAPFCYTGTRAAHVRMLEWSGYWTFHGKKGDIRRDTGNLQLFREGKCVQDLQLQDVHPGLRRDDSIQLDAFADAITTGKDRDWLQETSLGTWVLMETCNESARTRERVDVQAFRARLMA